MTEVGDLEAKLGHRFRNPRLLEQALTHGSVRHEQQTGEAVRSLAGAPDAAIPDAAISDNERLEFLGDAIVGMVIAELLYRRYPELNEGELTRLRAALVSRKHLGLVGTGLDLGSYLRLGRAEERNGGRSKAVLLANCVEALIGALYLEGGLSAAAGFVERAVANPYLEALRGELRENRAIGDYKTALQELLQARRARQPEYLVQAESGPDHRKRFLVEVRVGSDRAQAEGSTKKKAEQEAARLLYQEMRTRASVVEARPASPTSALKSGLIGHPAQEDGPPEGVDPSRHAAAIAGNPGLQRKRVSKVEPRSTSQAALSTPMRVSLRGSRQRLSNENVIETSPLLPTPACGTLRVEESGLRLKGRRAGKTLP